MKDTSHKAVPKKDGAGHIPMEPFAAVPEELRKCPQWVGWKYVENPNGPKPRKIPIDPRSGNWARTDDRATWGSFEEAFSLYQNGQQEGLGFVFSSEDPYCGIDLDHCIKRDGNPAKWAQSIVDETGSYTEWSPSKSGLHIIVAAKLTSTGRKTKQIEIYDRGRFFTVTGIALGSQRQVQSRQEIVDKLYQSLSRKLVYPSAAALRTLIGPELPDKAVLDSIAASGQGARFRKLYAGRWEHRYGSQSEADLALVGIIAAFIGKNPAQLDRIFRGSSLYRPKWDEFRGNLTYGQNTISKALGEQS